MENNGTERLDIVIIGVTGFTGKYVLEELHRLSKYEKNLTWGIAGRNFPKLQKVIEDLQNKTGEDLSKTRIILADISDPKSLEEMCKQTKVLINCCGPYRFYGESVVKACIQSLTHHVDVAGEPAYMEKMQLKYNDAAINAGVYVVSSCGFDSIPADLGVIYLQQNFKGPVNSVETYMSGDISDYKPNESLVNYATWDSLINSISSKNELSAIRKGLSPKKMQPMLPKLTKRSTLHKNKTDKKWYIEFPGADRSVVNRSQKFLYDHYNMRPAQMYAYFGFSSVSNALKTIVVGAVTMMLSKYACGKSLLLNHPKLFSLGIMSHNEPNKETMENMTIWVTIQGKGWDEKEIDFDGKAPTKSMTVQVTGVNPLYGATATAVVLSALIILNESDKMPGKGGVIPPGAAFAKTSLIEKLNANNFTFKIVNTDRIISKL